MSRVLFILKRKEDYNIDRDNHIGLSTGLYNSANFMYVMLNDMGIESKLVVVPDNNAIDREVTNFKPTHVIVEALWVVPQKFLILQKLHPNVKWIIRLHSEMPFMAGEGMAMDWIGEYSKFKNIIIGVNAPRMLREMKFFLQHLNDWDDKTANEKVIYLPNYYPQEYKSKKLEKDKDNIDIGCFGAVRPLKNHLVQALAAVEFADNIGKKLRFHVNAGRIEMQGQPAVSNLKGLFQHFHDKGHTLINHTWTPREQFLELCGQMDLALQCNFSETFNIVGADVISQGVPLIGSKEIPWQTLGLRDPTNGQDIIEGLRFAYRFPQLNVKTNQLSLKNYTNKTKRIWFKQFKEN
jgi:hypothetical protein